MPYTCEIIEQAEQTVASIRMRTPVQDLPKVLGQACGAIAQYLGEQGVKPAGPPFAAYYNMDMQDLDVEAGFPVAQSLEGKDNIQSGQLPACRAATCVHVGPYKDIEPAYNALIAWIKENNLETIGIVYEFYLNDPQTTPPDKLMTKIIMPLKAE